MSDEEVDELLKMVDTSSGEINYLGRPAVSRVDPYKTDWTADFVQKILEN